MLKIIKNLLKKYFLILKVRNRFGPEVQISQRKLYHYYRDCLKTDKLPGIEHTGFRVFSQFEEDGLLLYIFALLGMKNKTFIEIGSDDGVNSNSANLYFNFAWHGLFIDANPKSIKRGRKFFSKYPHPWMYKPKFECSKVTAENINNLIKKNGFEGSIGLLSIDIDGNDYWIWKAISQIEADVVIIETHNEFGLRNIVVPYEPEYSFPGKHPLYHGASPIAMKKLGKSKGYRLVGANSLGFNFLFVKDNLCGDNLPEKNVEDLLKHPSMEESEKGFEEIKNMKFIEP